MYREYDRKQLVPFQIAVAKAIKTVQTRGNNKPELILSEDKSDEDVGRPSSKGGDAMPGISDRRSDSQEAGGTFQRGNGKPSVTFVEHRSAKRKQESDSGVLHPRKRSTAGRATNEESSFLAKPQDNETGVSFSDLGGLDKEISYLRELIERPLQHPEVYSWLGVQPPRGVLLHGPPGCGKTALAKAVANETGVPFFSIAGPEVVSSMSGESESRLRQLFEEAKASAPSMIFIDEIDSMAPKRETAHKEMERRIVAQLLSCLDGLGEPPIDMDRTTSDPQELVESAGKACKAKSKHVVIIGATNRPESIDPALRRAGRFDREVCLGIPDDAQRAAILTVMTKSLRLGGQVCIQTLARKTAGYVAADLGALTKEAAAACISRSFAQLAQEGMLVPGEALEPASLVKLAVTSADFDQALTQVQPSIQREGFATVPGVTWADIGALEEVKEELHYAITLPIQQPEKFEALGLKTATGVLLYGPPGCGKTLVAKAVANHCGANFISIKGPELLNKYVGESERSVRQLFGRARAAAPCVLFFDELDALAPRRGKDSGNAATERVVNQLLTEMDGTDARSRVYLIATTNRPDIIDPALLRPGRLDKLLYVPLPNAEERVSIAKTLLKTVPIQPGLDPFPMIHDACKGFSGADVAQFVREAAIAALKDDSLRVGHEHFQKALERVKPSVSHRDERLYEGLSKNLRKARGIAKAEPQALP